MHIFTGRENYLPEYRELASNGRGVLILWRGGLIECRFMWCQGVLMLGSHVHCLKGRAFDKKGAER